MADCKEQRFSDPPGIGLVLDANGNPKPPYSQIDIDLSEQCDRAKKIMDETGDEGPFMQWLDDHAKRQRELTAIRAGTRR